MTGMAGTTHRARVKDGRIKVVTWVATASLFSIHGASLCDSGSFDSWSVFEYVPPGGSFVCLFHGPHEVLRVSTPLEVRSSTCTVIKTVPVMGVAKLVLPSRMSGFVGNVRGVNHLALILIRQTATFLETLIDILHV